MYATFPFAETAGLVELYVSEGLLPPTTRLFPELGGLLQWAGSGNGHRWVWKTTGDPNEWTVVAMANDLEGQLHVYADTMSSYLANLLAGRYSDEFSERVNSTPWDPPLNHFVAAL